MPSTLIDKLWDSHVVEKKDGFPDILAIDLHLCHEVTTPQAFTELRTRGLPLHAPHRTLATIDHNVSTAPNRETAGSAESHHQMATLRENCAAFDVPLLDLGSGKQGIVHVISPELGLTQPGQTIVCGDSHTSTHGAFGALAFGIGTTEISQVMATGCLLLKKPRTMRVTFTGTPQKGVYAKDYILALLARITANGATGHAIEFAGSGITALSMEERMTLCNMSIECGARFGVIAPDSTTYDYLRGRPYAPAELPTAYWDTLHTDDDAVFDTEITIDIATLAPHITWGTNPGQAAPIDTLVPTPADLPPAEQHAAMSALSYTQLISGQSLLGTPIDYVFIGSCTNSRLSDLRIVADILRGKRIADTVTCLIVPGSESIRAAAIAEGLDVVFRAAGADFRNPGCSMCLGMNEDKVPAGKRCVSTSNRNFIGRQGPGSITHLASPATAAISAVTGCITDIRAHL